MFLELFDIIVSIPLDIHKVQHQPLVLLTEESTQVLGVLFVVFPGITERIEVVYVSQPFPAFGESGGGARVTVFDIGQGILEIVNRVFAFPIGPVITSEKSDVGVIQLK